MVRPTTPPHANEWYWDNPPSPGTIGSAHSVSSDEAGEDRAEQVRKVAEEVSRKSFPRPVRRVGF